VRWGLIGTGDIVRKRVAAALRDAPDSELVAVSRARADLAAAFAAEFRVRKWHADWCALLADPDVDAVYIATPVHLHAPQTIAAAEAGKHVLCEKPMALDVAECDAMIAACRAAGVRLGIAYYRHFYPVVRRIKELLTSGEIGTAAYAHINAFEWFDPPADHPRTWLLQRDQAGGGPMFDFGCHRLEVLLNCFGPVRRVAGATGNALFERDVEDTAAAVLQFESGVCATVAVSHAAREPRDTFEIYGSRGSLTIDNLNAGEVRIRSSLANASASDRTERLAPASNLHQPLIDDFVEAVGAGRDPAVGGETGREVARMEQAIYAKT
jgi:predicted dehydrogenase